MILFLLVWFLAAETLVFRGIRAVVVGHFSTADLLGHRWSTLQPLGLHQAGCFTLSQSQQPATLNVVAANSGTERYESSLVRLLTEDTLSPLCSSSVLFASLCISSLPPQLCFGVGRPLFSSPLDLPPELRIQFLPSFLDKTKNLFLSLIFLMYY